MTDSDLKNLLVANGWRNIFREEWTGQADSDSPKFEDIRRLVDAVTQTERYRCVNVVQRNQVRSGTRPWVDRQSQEPPRGSRDWITVWDTTSSTPKPCRLADFGDRDWCDVEYSQPTTFRYWMPSPGAPE